MRGPLLPSGTRGPGDRTPLSTGTDGARRPHALLNRRSVRRQMERDRGNDDLGQWAQSTAQAGGRATVRAAPSTSRLARARAPPSHPEGRSPVSTCSPAERDPSGETATRRSNRAGRTSTGGGNLPRSGSTGKARRQTSGAADTRPHSRPTRRSTRNCSLVSPAAGRRGLAVRPTPHLGFRAYPPQYPVLLTAGQPGGTDMAPVRYGSPKHSCGQ